jgi:hypothetical protein
MVKQSLILLIVVFNLYSNDAIFLKSGEKAPFDGFLVTEKRIEELRQKEDKFNFIQEELTIKDKLIAKQVEENQQLKALNLEYENNIRLLNMKLNTYIDLNALYKSKADESFKIEAKLNLYKLGFSVTLAVGVAELFGFGCFMLAYYIKDKI